MQMSFVVCGLTTPQLIMGYGVLWYTHKFGFGLERTNEA